MIRETIHDFGNSFGLFMAPTLIASVLVLITLALFFRLRSGEEPDALNDKTTTTIAPWLALGLTLLATVISWSQARQGAEHASAAQFSSESQAVQPAIAASVQRYTDLLTAAQAVVASDDFKTADWDAYMRSVDMDNRYPGLYGLGYITDIPNNRLSSFLSKARRALGQDFHVTPEGDRPDYFVVRYMEPASRNAGLLGYDIGSDPTLRLAAERARDTGTAVFPERTTLLDDTSHRTFLYLMPVYLADQPVSTREERELSLKGWVVERFRQDDILKDLSFATFPHVRVQVFEGVDVTRDALFYDSSGFFGGWERPVENPTIIRSVNIGDHTWTIRISPKAALQSTGAAGPVAAVFGGGLILSLWTFAMVWAFRNSRRRAFTMAREMTIDLRTREAALVTSPNAIVLVDATQSDLPIEFVNPRFEKLTGYSAEEAIGRNCRFLQGDDKDQKGLRDLRKALQEQREVRVLLRNYRKDGTPFWNDLSVTPIRNPMGRVSRFVGTLQDVTDRELTERRLSSQIAVIRGLAEATSLPEAATRVLQALGDGQDWQVGALWALDTSASGLRCIEVWRQNALEIQELETFMRETVYQKGAGLPGLVWSRAEPVWMSDIAKDPAMPETPLLLKAGLTGVCGFPIASRNGLQGVLTFYSQKLWPLNKNLLLLMVSSGAQISQFMEREETQWKEKEVNRLERGLAEFMGDGLIAMDKDGLCIYANSAAGKTLGYQPRMLLGQPLHEVIHPNAISNGHCNPKECPLLLSLKNVRSQRIDDQAVFWRHDRSAIPVAYTTSPIIDGGVIRGVVLTFNDVTNHRLLEENLQAQLARKDDDLKNALGTIDELRRAITAPPVPASNAGDAPAPTRAASVLEGKTILLVEEDKSLRLKWIAGLKRKGIDVLSAANAGEALLLCEQRPNQIHALVTDFMLTHMSGKTLVQRLGPLEPSVQVIYTSTYGLKALEDLQLLEPGMHFLHKPFSADHLIYRLQEILK